ncbi:uncharacterized protein LOC111295687 isoform X2 [Durio zibethinus]|uniref:acylphosphatase n=1 Tax=Durio zibethinus TaxID=66656 RepID=A0A6P5YX04_DURZI|nr:uncharacterized protein LOC111295687 isoform X2 [Durio zibethinus]
MFLGKKGKTMDAILISLDLPGLFHCFHPALWCSPCVVHHPGLPLCHLLRHCLHPFGHCLPSVRVVIKGRVQGVFYRNWTIENATQLGLKGWVRNRRDGSVEALFSGSPESVQEMEQRCRRGPPAAMVTGLQVFPSNDDPGTGFERKSTV